jgi:hypothetical protein
MENENETIEPNVASGFGEPSLDADPLDPDVDVALDRLLDEAEGIAEPEQINEPIETESSDPIEETTEEVPEMVDPVERESTEQTESTESTNEPESELDPEIAAIERPRNLSEKNQSNWRKLQETASSYKKQAEEAAQLRQKLDEAQQQVKTPDDYDELRRFRAIFDIQNDPEFRSKFEKPISDAKENIYRILKANGASDEVIKSIEENGGPDKIDSKWWKTNAIDRLPLTEAERLKRNLVDVVELKEKQQFEIKHFTKHV